MTAISIRLSWVNLNSLPPAKSFSGSSAMNFQLSAAMIASALALTAPASTLVAQGTIAPARPLQAQIDELRQGQEQIRKDLAEIKALLLERAARAEAPVARMPPPMVSLNVHGEPFRGSAAARVAILEYSDFDCTYCATYARDIYPLLDQAYVKTGKVKYFFRDLPNPEHPNALFKARMARCAGEQDRFWEAHDRLFRDQRPFDGPGLTQFMKDLGLDAPAFQACISSNRYIDAIQRSAGLANGMRINGTPAFLIGRVADDGSIIRASKIFLGAESFEAFRKVLDELLASAEAPASKGTKN
jgi:protein-disulfide isomerase